MLSIKRVFYKVEASGSITTPSYHNELLPSLHKNDIIEKKRCSEILPWYVLKYYHPRLK